MLPIVLLAWVALSIVAGLFTGLFIKAARVRVPPVPRSARPTPVACIVPQTRHRDRVDA